MDPTREASPAVEELVDGLMQSYGQLALILEHMHRHENPDAPPIPLVLGGILTGVFSELHDEHGEEDLATAAQIVRSAIELVGENIFLGDPSEFVPERPPPRANRVGRRPTRRRRGR